MNWTEASSTMKRGKKVKREHWHNTCICQYLTGIDLIPWRKHPIIQSTLTGGGMPRYTKLDGIWLFTNPNTIIPYWQPSQDDMNANDWKEVLVKPRTCDGCGKKFDYGDEQSPVLTTELWETVKTLLSLENEDSNAGKSYYVCYECVEKILGRKLTHNDLPPCIFNEAFENHYFKNTFDYNEKEAKAFVKRNK